MKKAIALLMLLAGLAEGQTIRPNFVTTNTSMATASAALAAITSSTLSPSQPQGAFFALASNAPVFIHAGGPAPYCGTGPTSSCTFIPAIANPGEGAIIEWSVDGINWQSITPDGSFVFQNNLGARDESLFDNWANDGFFYMPFTCQGPYSGGSSGIGLARSSDLLHWQALGAQGGIAGQIVAPEGVATPGIVSGALLNGTNVLYDTTAQGGNNVMYGRLQLDASFTNWSSRIVLVTNEVQPGQAVNDSFVLVTNGEVYIYIENQPDQSYDVYTNIVANFPGICHLYKTNITGAGGSLNSEGGGVFQMPNGVWRFYGAGSGGNSQAGQYIYSDSTNITGPWTGANICTENPRATFGHAVILPLIGQKKTILAAAIAAGSAQVTDPTDAKFSFAAYGVNRLSQSYTGPSMAVRRSSDNNVTNIYFLGNDLDTTTLASYCGSGNGFVATWYDQSGHGYNVTQSTTGNQPQIVSSGTVITGANGKAALSFAGTFSLTSPTVVLAAGQISAYAVVERNWPSSAYSFVLQSANYGASAGIGFGVSANSGGTWNQYDMLAISGGYGTPLSPYAFGGVTNRPANGTWELVNWLVGQSGSGVWLDGVNITHASGNAYATPYQTTLTLGGPANTFDGDLQTLILYDGMNGVNQQSSISARLNQYFLLYPSPPAIGTNIQFTDTLTSTTNTLYFTNGLLWKVTSP